MDGKTTLAGLRLDVELLMQDDPARWPAAQMQRAKAVAFDLTRYAAYFGRPNTTDAAWVYASLTKLQAIINARNPIVQ